MQVDSCDSVDVRPVDSGNNSALLSTGPGTGQPYAIFKPTK